MNEIMILKIVQKFKWLAVIFLVGLSVSGCGPGVWHAFIYPDKNDWDQIVSIGIFSSLDECRAAAIDHLKEISSLEDGFYECGYNCRFDEGKELYRTCDEESK